MGLEVGVGGGGTVPKRGIGAVADGGEDSRGGGATGVEATAAEEEEEEVGAWDGKPGKKMWADYLVFFEQAEGVMATVLAGSGYAECWRGWNSWGHEDWRRRGDMVVWCLRGRDGRRGKKDEREGGLEGGKKKKRGFWSGA